MSEPDDLFTLRNHFWLGSYQLAIAEGSGLGRLSENLRIERDEFIYRSYIALGQHTIVLGEVRRVTENWFREPRPANSGIGLVRLLHPRDYESEDLDARAGRVWQCLLASSFEDAPSH